MLNVPKANKQLYSLIATGQCNCMSQMTKDGTTSQNGTPIIIHTPKSGTHQKPEQSTVSDYSEAQGLYLMA